MSQPLSKKSDPGLQTKLEEIDTRASTPQVRHFTTTPHVSQVAKGSHVTALVGGTYYLYINVNGTLKKVALT